MVNVLIALRYREIERKFREFRRKFGVMSIFGLGVFVKVGIELMLCIAGSSGFCCGIFGAEILDTGEFVGR